MGLSLLHRHLRSRFRHLRRRPQFHHRRRWPRHRRCRLRRRLLRLDAADRHEHPKAQTAHIHGVHGRHFRRFLRRRSFARRGLDIKWLLALVFPDQSPHRRLYRCHPGLHLEGRAAKGCREDHQREVPAVGSGGFHMSRSSCDMPPPSASMGRLHLLLEECPYHRSLCPQRRLHRSFPRHPGLEERDRNDPDPRNQAAQYGGQLYFRSLRWRRNVGGHLLPSGLVPGSQGRKPSPLRHHDHPNAASPCRGEHRRWCPCLESSRVCSAVHDRQLGHHVRRGRPLHHIHDRNWPREMDRLSGNLWIGSRHGYAARCDCDSGRH